MGQTKHGRAALSLVALLIAGLLALPSPGLAQLGGLLPPIGSSPPPTTTSGITGDAAAVRATLFGALGLLTTTTALSDTGTLAGTDVAREASQVTGSIPSLLGAEVLSASTIAWPDQVASEASLSNLNLGVAGIAISADSVLAQASQVAGAAGTGTTTIDNLLVNGVPVAITGAPNQIVAIPGGQLIINEQTISSTGTAVVNALHVTVAGVVDVVIASATAGIA
jgi:hypothetical protein